MRLKTSYNKVNKVSVKRPFHHAAKRAKFSDEYHSMTKERFGSRTQFGAREEKPLSNKPTW